MNKETLKVSNIINDEEELDDDDGYDYCWGCNGSGEDMYDGSSCGICGGSGALKIKDN